MPKRLLQAVCFLLFIGQAKAQQSSILEMGVGVGAAVYQGDLSPYRLGNLAKPNPSFQAFIHSVFHPAFSVRGNYAFASLKEDEAAYPQSYHPYRAFAFESSVNELSVQVIINPLRNNLEQDNRRLQPYLFAGAGFSFLSIRRDWSRFNPDFGWQSWVQPGLAQDTLATMPKSVITYPVGLGIRYFAGENVSLYAETNHRVTRNGYLDGFSLAANPRRDDAFTTLTMGIIFRLSGYRGAQGIYGCPVNVW